MFSWAMDFIIWKVKCHKSEQTKQNNQTKICIVSIISLVNNGFQAFSLVA